MDRHAWLLPGAVYRPARLEREVSSAERLAKGEIEPDGPLLIAATRCRWPQRMAGQGRTPRLDRRRMNGRDRRVSPVAAHSGEGRLTREQRSLDFGGDAFRSCPV